MASPGRRRAAGPLRLFLARSLAQGGLLATLGVVVCVLTALLAALAGFLELSATTSVRAALATAPALASGYRFEVAASEDPTRQIAAGERIFVRELDGVPATITSLYRSGPVSASSHGVELADRQGAPARLVVVAGTDLVEHARLVSGRWPASPAPGTQTDAVHQEATLHDSAMTVLGLQIGDTVELGREGERVELLVVGSWLPEDGRDPFWFSDVLLLTGAGYPTADGARAFGPLVVAGLPQGTPLASVLEGSIQWAILPDPDRIRPDDLAAAITAAGTIQRALADDPATSNGRVSVLGDLDDTATRFSRAQNAIRGITPIGLILVALIGTITLAQVARLLVVARRPDGALLASRGATRARLVGHPVAEAVVVCGLGAAAGAGLAPLLLAPFLASSLPDLGSGPAPPGGGAPGSVSLGPVNLGPVSLGPAGWAAAVAMTGVIVVLATALGDALRTADGTTAQGLTSGTARSRSRTIAAAGTVALTVAAAALAIGQSLVYGSPIVTDAAGRQSVDPLTVAAPALGLVAGCLLLLAAAVPLARWAERLAALGRMLQPALGARQLARGLGRSSAAILVISLAVGALVITSSYSGTRSALDASTGLLRVGADERLVFREGRQALAGMESVLAERYRSLPGVADAAPVLVAGIRLPGNLEGVLTAIAAARLPGVMTDVRGALDTVAVAAALPAGAAFGLEVPAGTSVVFLRGTLTGQAPDRTGPVATSAEVDGTVWFESADGSLLASPFGPVLLDSGASSTVVAETVLPEGTSGWRIVAVDLRAAASQYWTVELEVAGFDAEGPDGTVRALPFSGGDWTSQLALGENGFEPAATFRSDAGSFAIGLSLRYGNHDGARAMAVSQAAPLSRRSDYAGIVNPLPIAVSRSLADALYLEAGATIDLRVTGTSSDVTATVTEILEHVPGTPSSPAVLADLPSLNEHLLRTSTLVFTPNELWIDTEGAPVDVAAIAGAGVHVGTPADSTVAAITAPAETSLWIAATGCLLFAILSLGAVALTVRRARRVDVVVLRAEGLPAPVQARARFGETSVVSAAAIGFGLLGGGLVAALTVPNLARTVVLEAPADLPAVLLPALAPGLALLGLLAVALTVVVAVDAAIVRRRADDPGTRWESP